MLKVCFPFDKKNNWLWEKTKESFKKNKRILKTQEVQNNYKGYSSYEKINFNKLKNFLKKNS